jgi:hypothetical protein
VDAEQQLPGVGLSRRSRHEPKRLARSIELHCACGVAVVWHQEVSQQTPDSLPKGSTDSFPLPPVTCRDAV